jgi:hypothetical protein
VWQIVEEKIGEYFLVDSPAEARKYTSPFARA